MTQRLNHTDPLLRVESQTLLQQIDRERVRIGVQTLEGFLLLKGEGAEVVSTALGTDGVEVVEGGSAEDAEDQGELMVVCSSCRKGRG
jgi:hypothetical protein